MTPAPFLAKGQVDASGDDTMDLEATVLAVIPRYSVVKVRTLDGHQYSLTKHTKGVVLSELQEGQRLLCTVTRKLPRVLAAQVLA